MPVFSTDLSTRSCEGRAVVALRGELDLADATAVAAALAAVAAREPQIIVDLMTRPAWSGKPRGTVVEPATPLSAALAPAHRK